MEIRIVKDNYGSLFAYNEKYAFALFQFEYRDERMGGPAWYFWLRGDFIPVILECEKKDFPMQFFLDACKAKSFLLRCGELDEDVVIVKGKKYLK